MELEKRLPFITAIIGGIIAWVSSLLFFREYLALMTAVLLIAILLARFEPWAFLGSFLIGLATELYNRNQSEQFYIVLVVLILGCVLQIIYYSTQGSEQSLVVGYMPLGSLMIFAMTGMSVVLMIRLLSCNPSSQNMDSIIGHLLGGDCHDKRMSDFYAPRMFSQQGLELVNTIISSTLLAIAISPGFWASVLVSLRKIRFNLFKVGSFVSEFFKSYIGVLISSIVGFILMFIVAMPFYFFQLLFPVAEHQLNNIFVLLVITIHYFSIIFGASWLPSRTP